MELKSFDKFLEENTKKSGLEQIKTRFFVAKLYNDM